MKIEEIAAGLAAELRISPEVAAATLESCLVRFNELHGRSVRGASVPTDVTESLRGMTRAVIEDTQDEIRGRLLTTGAAVNDLESRAVVARQERDLEIVKARDYGLLQREIAEITRVERARVGQILARHNTTPK